MKSEILDRMRWPRPKGRQAFENRLGKFERDLTLPMDGRSRRFVQSPRPRWPAVAVAGKQRNELASFIHHASPQRNQRHFQE